jgi:hypothetical protein
MVMRPAGGNLSPVRYLAATIVGVAVLVLTATIVSTTAPGGVESSGGAPAATDKKKCKTVTKKVRGKKRKVRVCRTVKPKPKPPPPPPPAPQLEKQIVDVGGYRLYIECVGTGAPTVILAHGANDSHTRWAAVEAEASSTTRVCAYDRAGDGGSDPRPEGRYPAGRVVDDLHALLANARIPGPYVIAGHSIGGFYARLYAKHYPGEVTGLVLVDGVPEQWLANWLVAYQQTGTDEGAEFSGAIQELTTFSTGSTPLVVLVQGLGTLSIGSYEGWDAGQKSIAQRSSNAWLVRARGVGHNIPQGNPGLVAESIRAVVSAARGAAALPACASSAVSAARGECLDPNAS